MPERTIVVFTYRPLSAILEEGGSQAWALKAANARRCKYIVCTRNRFFAGASPEEQAAAPEDHGAAFVIGKITTVEPSPERVDRFIIRFVEYAILEPKPAVWRGARNPVWYVHDIGQLGIDPDSLNWQRMPKGASDASAIADAPQSAIADPDATPPAGISFDQARAGLAIAYGVAPAKVEILIRG